MTEKRLSEKEVALVLRRAAEIDASGGRSGGGMTASDIEAVALEAGIGRDAVRRALTEISVETGGKEGPFDGPPSRRAVRSVAGELTREQLEALVRAIEDEAGRPGTVSEALGTIRWTASDSATRTIQVSLSTSDDQTRIGVHERVSDAVHRVFYLLPTLWGAILGIAPAATAELSAVPFLAVVASAAGLGFGIGRGVFAWRSRKMRDRVEALAERLSYIASDLRGGARPALSRAEGAVESGTSPADAGRVEAPVGQAGPRAPGTDELT